MIDWIGEIAEWVGHNPPGQVLVVFDTPAVKRKCGKSAVHADVYRLK